MDSFNKELSKLLRDLDIFNSNGEDNTEEEATYTPAAAATYSQLIEELKNYSNIVAGFRKKSLVGKETLRLKIT